jgi:hypothetical protein
MFKLDENSAPRHEISGPQPGMNSKTKIRLDSIEKAHRALDALPEHHPEELTKTQAIQRLLVPIRASQSKGYSLAAIGQVLSECGIPITTGALRAYVSEANAAAGGRKTKKLKRSAKTPKDQEAAAPKESQKDGPPRALQVPTKSAGAGATRAVDLRREPDAQPSKPATWTQGVPKGTFVPREDTEDL